MAKKIKIDVEVNGKMQKATISAKKLADALDKAGHSARTTDRRFKGASQQSANATKNFSKMAQGITGGLVPAYATLAANVFALTAAYNFLKRAGDLEALRQAQTEYAYSTGTSMKLLTSRLQEATGGLLTFDEAAQAAAIGTAAGLSSDQLEGLAAVAKKASAALGRDLTDSFNRLTRGAIKAEPELLDELGIIVRLNDVTRDYKRILNITGRELNTFEKSQAVVNAVLEQGREKFQNIGEAQNDIAKLGKAVDDLVKSIQTGIVPVATFIAEVFSKNILALGAAATVMGVQLVKALAPAAPALGNLSEAAEKARKRMKKIAGPSVIGKEIKKGTFEERQIRAIEKASKSKTSKVINLSKMEREAIKRDLILIKADHARTMAANSTGFTKYTAGVRAQFYVLAAEHGKLMGGMRLGVAGLANFASRAMNAIAILGVITLAISFAKELLDLLKDDELKKLEEKVETLQGRFKEQNEEVSDLVKNLKDADTELGRIVQQANLLSNLSLAGLPGLTFEKASGNFVRSGQTTNFSKDDLNVIDRNKIKLNALEGAIETFKLQRDILRDAGRDTQELDRHITALDLNFIILSKRVKRTTESVTKYNDTVADTNLRLEGAITTSTRLAAGLTTQAAAVKSITVDYENYIQLLEKFKAAPTNLSVAINLLKSLRENIQTGVGGRTGFLQDLFEQDKLKNIAAMLNKPVDIVGQMRPSDVIGDLNAAGELEGGALEGRIKALQELRDRELIGSARIAEAFEREMNTKLPFLEKEARQKRQIALIDEQIFELQKKLRTSEITGLPVEEDERLRVEAETAALIAKKRTLEESFSDIGRLGDALGTSLESSLTRSLDGLIQGTMTAKEAFANMATSMLQSLAKVIAELLTARLLTSALGAGGPFASFGSFLGVGNRYGGVMSDGAKAPGYAVGGIAKGPQAGYPAILHGTEAVVPLPNGKSIPVDMKGAGQNNNVTVNVAIDSQGNARQDAQADSNQGANLGSAIAAAVQKELQNQKRAGGILNPMGVS